MEVVSKHNFVFGEISVNIPSVYTLSNTKWLISKNIKEFNPSNIFDISVADVVTKLDRSKDFNCVQPVNI